MLTHLHTPSRGCGSLCATKKTLHRIPCAPTVPCPCVRPAPPCVSWPFTTTFSPGAGRVRFSPFSAPRAIVPVAGTRCSNTAPQVQVLMLRLPPKLPHRQAQPRSLSANEIRLQFKTSPPRVVGIDYTASLLSGWPSRIATGNQAARSLIF